MTPRWHSPEPCYSPELRLCFPHPFALTMPCYKPLLLFFRSNVCTVNFAAAVAVIDSTLVWLVWLGTWTLVGMEWFEPCGPFGCLNAVVLFYMTSQRNIIAVGCLGVEGALQPPDASGPILVPPLGFLQIEDPNLRASTSTPFGLTLVCIPSLSNRFSSRQQ